MAVPSEQGVLVALSSDSLLATFHLASLCFSDCFLKGVIPEENKHKCLQSGRQIQKRLPPVENFMFCLFRNCVPIYNRLI